MENNPIMQSYVIRSSRRARRLKLSVSPRDGLVVTVPEGYDVCRVPEFVASKADWIANTQALLTKRYPHLGDICEKDPSHCDGRELPKRIVFRLMDANWRVGYRPTLSSRVEVSEGRDEHLIVHGRISDRRACRKKLQQWLTRWACRVLPEYLAEISDIIGLNFSKVSVRNQKSRWGSCSSKGEIHLNRRLLFLPPHLARYICIHELCHTVQMNHSKRFWQLVAEHEPHYRQYDHETSHAAWYTYVPAWVDNGNVT